MSTTDTTRVTAEVLPEARTLSDATSILSQARSLNELMFMAGESLVKTDREMANAFCTGAELVDNLLLDVRAILYAAIEREGGKV